MAERRSLFEKLGGEAAIEAAVVRFYDKVIADPLTAPFFARLDLPTQIRKQISFMATAFGAPKAYQGRDLIKSLDGSGSCAFAGADTRRNVM